MSRMRRYTTISLCVVVLTLVGTSALQMESPFEQVFVVVVGAAVTAQTVFWERRPPLWLALVAVGSSAALWSVGVAGRNIPLTALLFAIAVALQVSHLRTHRLWWSMTGLAAVLAPVGVAALLAPEQNWLPWLLAGTISYVAAAGFFLLNDYGWGLYLEIDTARQVGAQLAVAQERYRFAADLHDIQGHTLHVIRLKTQLAKKLIDRDPDAAKAQLGEAEELIVETLANTRSLAFGERQVALASELANAEELLVAAGIGWTVNGSPTPGPHDELLGLVMRESTTNMLRHAQPTTVTVTLGPGRLVVTNDGSPATSRPPSGLATLGERFAAVGGSLRTSVTDGVFTTEARLA